MSFSLGDGTSFQCTFYDLSIPSEIFVLDELDSNKRSFAIAIRALSAFRKLTRFPTLARRIARAVDGWQSTPTSWWRNELVHQ